MKQRATNYLYGGIRRRSNRDNIMGHDWLNLVMEIGLLISVITIITVLRKNEGKRKYKRRKFGKGRYEKHILYLLRLLHK